MGYKNQQALEMVGRWQEWSRTRRKYVPQPTDSVLASMMAGPKKSRPFSPDWDNDPEAAYFHLALLSVPENRRLAFLRVYGDFPELNKPVKCWCDVLGGISRDTFYRFAHETANSVMARMKRMQRDCQKTADNDDLTNLLPGITIQPTVARVAPVSSQQ